MAFKSSPSAAEGGSPTSIAFMKDILRTIFSHSCILSLASLSYGTFHRQHPSHSDFTTEDSPCLQTARKSFKASAYLMVAKKDTARR